MMMHFVHFTTIDDFHINKVATVAPSNLNFVHLVGDYGKFQKDNTYGS